MSFEDVHNVAKEYFWKHEDEKRSFTHNVCTDEAKFWLYFNEAEHVDFFQELQALNKPHEEWKITDCSKFSVFNVGKAEPWMDYENVVCFTITKISEQ